jgi:hypothetical protein
MSAPDEGNLASKAGLTRPSNSASREPEAVETPVADDEAANTDATAPEPEESDESETETAEALSPQQAPATLPVSRWIVVPRAQRPPINDAPLHDDIEFSLREVADDVPPDQVKLHSEIEKTLTLLRAIFPARNTDSEQGARFSEYFAKLVGLSHVGFGMSYPRSDIATYALQALHQEIVELEGGRIKNGYIRRLGLAAVASSLVAIAIWIVFVFAVRYGCGAIEWTGATLSCAPSPDNIALIPIVRTFALMWVACQIGSWVSFNIRKVTISVYDLSNFESDRVEPLMRLLFTGLLSLVFGLIILTNIASVEIGGFGTKELQTNGLIALLVGAFCGLSEQALASAVTIRAAETITSITGKK